ncbi:hypothetical protein [Acetivibrio saccincola]|uniref:Uncharacterized protein n=1 Tax=Acetivibrio saccincola TaxID=1677857 RepID=A0A2S8R819_9FIRM|nr:hypothetical protein [Acetivibrio saccincola]PQQ65948.1 hypothetical protein B9R14_03650 [Acetivibrio saccincola]
MNNTIKNRIILGLKSFIIIFLGGLLLELIVANIGHHKINILKSFLNSFGFSVGLSVFGNVFITAKKLNNETLENEKLDRSFYGSCKHTFFFSYNTKYTRNSLCSPIIKNIKKQSCNSRWRFKLC